MMKFLRAGAVTISLAAFAQPVIGHDHAAGVVKERMDMMETMAKHMKAITERIKGKTDLGAIKPNAEAIAEHAPHLVHLFPKGSMQRPTEARPAIWQNWQDFEGKASAVKIEAKKLAAIDAKDFPALEAGVLALSKTCSACHEKYRVRKVKGE